MHGLTGYSYKYHYDTPGTSFPGAKNLRGKLSYVEWPTGTHAVGYDALGRLTKEVETLWNGTSPFTMQKRETFTQSYNYNAGGQLLSQSAPGGLNLNFDYNARSLLSKVSGGFAGDNSSIFSGIKYDHRGATVKTDARNNTSTYAFYDNRSRLAAVITGKTDKMPSYSANLNYKKPLTDAIQQLVYTRTPTGLLSGVTDIQDTNPDRPSSTASFTATYQYDRLYQLTEARTSDGTINYAYDTIQNLVSRTTSTIMDDLVDGEFKYGQRGNGPNQITGTKYQNFDYNKVGQMKRYNGFDLYFDVEGRLVEADKPGGTNIKYYYDDTGAKKLAVIKKPDKPRKIYRYVFGNYQIRDGEETWLTAGATRPRRTGCNPAASRTGVRSALPYYSNGFISGGQGQAEVKRSKGLEVDLYLLDELANYVSNPADKTKPLPAEYMDLDGDGDNNFDDADLQIALDAYWSEQPVKPVGTGDNFYIWRYYHKDHLGGNTVVTDSTGDVVSTQRFHPYGQTASRTGIKPVYGFAGGEIEEEEELGLIQFGARWYAPEIGRWVSADPLYAENPTKNVESPLESGLFAYSHNSPVNFKDPFGMDDESATCDINDDFNAMMNESTGQSVDKSLENAIEPSPPAKKSTNKKKKSTKSKKDTTNGSTVAISAGVNGTFVTASSGFYLNMFVDWRSGDIGFSASQPIAVNPAIEMSAQGSITAGDATVDELVNGSDATASFGADAPGTDIGGGYVRSLIYDKDGTRTGTMNGFNASAGIGDGLVVDVSAGTSVTLAGGHFNAYEVSQEAIPIAARMIENPAEGFYEAWAPIAHKFDVFGILD